jgi:hypothetical protein
MISYGNIFIVPEESLKETIPARTFDISRENEIIRLIEQHQRK